MKEFVDILKPPHVPIWIPFLSVLFKSLLFLLTLSLWDVCFLLRSTHKFWEVGTNSHKADYLI